METVKATVALKRSRALPLVALVGGLCATALVWLGPAAKASLLVSGCDLRSVGRWWVALYEIDG